MRRFCAAEGIGYQGFSLLTANRDFLQGKIVSTEGRGYPQLILKNAGNSFSGFYKKFKDDRTIQKKTVSQIVFRFAQQAGILPLTGTQSERHMQEDLQLQDFSLNEEQFAFVENVALRE